MAQMSSQLSLSEAAAFLKVSEKSIRRYIKAGRLHASLTKGKKGYEYRIKHNDILGLHKPPKGKPSHRQKRPAVAKSYQKPLRKIQRVRQLSAPNHHIMQVLDYKALYDQLFSKYEQMLVVVGSQEAGLKTMPLQYEGRLHELEKLASQKEELIMELYQIIQEYKKRDAQREG